MPFISFAQNCEDVMLWRALGHLEGGFYIDIGAWSPDEDSVTRAFYDRGWRGINVEPNPAYFAQLCAGRPEDTTLQLAVSDHAGRITLNVFGDTGLATADEAIAQRHREAGRTATPHDIEAVTLADLCARHVPADQAIHFLKIDVEGLETAVLRGADWDRWRPWIVVVEATEPGSQEPAHADWEPILTGARYRMAYADGLNRFYVAEEQAGLLPALRYPPNVFDEFVPAAQDRLAAAHAEDAARLADHAGQLAAQSASLGALDAGLTTLDAGVRMLDGRVAAHQAGLAGLSAGITALDTGIRLLDGNITAQQAGLAALETGVRTLADSSAAQDTGLAGVRARLDGIDAGLEPRDARLIRAEAGVEALQLAIGDLTWRLDAMARTQAYLAQRRWFERLLFRPGGKPVRLLRRILFHKSGKPRRRWWRIVLHKDGRPRRAFAQWMTGDAYRSLPGAVGVRSRIDPAGPGPAAGLAGTPVQAAPGPGAMAGAGTAGPGADPGQAPGAMPGPVPHSLRTQYFMTRLDAARFAASHPASASSASASSASASSASASASASASRSGTAPTRDR